VAFSAQSDIDPDRGRLVFIRNLLVLMSCLLQQCRIITDIDDVLAQVGLWNAKLAAFFLCEKGHLGAGSLITEDLGVEGVLIGVLGVLDGICLTIEL
jgi:hypothetical protein